MLNEDEVNLLFDQGFDCSQIVLGEVADRLGMSKKQAYKVASCFGIGMAQGGVCGAVTGALMAIGLKYGNTEPGDIQRKKRLFDVRDEFIGRFTEINGMVNCPELLGQRVDTLQGLIETRFTGIYDRCPKYCAVALRLLDEYL